MMTKRIREMAQENSEIIQIVQDASGKEALVVDMFSYLSQLTPLADVELIREGADFYLEDVLECVREPISLYKEFMKKKSVALKFLKEVF